jgi:hypothetical protein
VLLLVLLEAILALTTIQAAREASAPHRVRASSAPGEPGRGVGVFAAALLFVVTLALLLHAAEWARRFRLRRTVLDLGARAILDAGGARLAGLDGASVAMRPQEKSVAGKLLGVLGVLVAIATVLGGTGDGGAASPTGIEVVVAWPGGVRVLCEPCSSSEAEALVAELVRLGLART